MGGPARESCASLGDVRRVAVALATCCLAAAPAAASVPPRGEVAQPLRATIDTLRVDPGKHVRTGPWSHRLRCGRQHTFTLRYVVRGARPRRGVANATMAVNMEVWSYTLRARARSVSAGVWSWSARAAIPCTFPRGTYTLGATLRLDVRGRVQRSTRRVLVS